MLAKLFAITVFLIRNVFVILSNKTLGRLQKLLFVHANKPSQLIAYNIRHKKKAK